MTFTPLMWAGFFAVILFLMILDLGVLHRKAHTVSVKEALKMVAFYVAVALAFNAWIFFEGGKQKGYEFLVGYLLELSLSVDNLFVFLLIMGHFAVPRQYQHRALFWGILAAIILRGVMIGFGIGLINTIDWIIYVFGGFLIFTGIKMLKAADAEPDLDKNRIVSFVRKHFRITRDYHGEKFFVRQKGVLYMTPLFVVLILINIGDVVFAVDSIPAIFAVTLDPFIVFTSNIFAILGLRSMYFALAGIMYRFEYLKYGLSIVLIFIGIKMVVNHYTHQDIITTEMSLLFILLALGNSVLYSMYKTRRRRIAAGKGHVKDLKGWVPGSEEMSPLKTKTVRKGKKRGR